jgi:tetratricopeptide (TPR) repeat protein
VVNHSIFLLFLFGLSACAGQAPLPARAVQLNQAGAEALASGDLETADARLSVALEYSPHFVEALINLGLVEMERGNFARARTLLQRARRLNPDVAQAHHALGVLSERERRPDRASLHYRDALGVDPGFAAARANLGRLQFDAAQFEDARLTFKKAIEVAPDERAAYSGLAESLIRLGRIDEAETTIERGITRFPDDPALIILRARSFLRLGQTGAARDLLEPIAGRRDEFSARALAWLGTLELLSGFPDRAASAAEKALALDPDDSLAVHVLTSASQAIARRDADGVDSARDSMGPARAPKPQPRR